MSLELNYFIIIATVINDVELEVAKVLLRSYIESISKISTLAYNSSIFYLL